MKASLKTLHNNPLKYLVWLLFNDTLIPSQIFYSWPDF